MNLTIEKMIYGGDGLARNPEGKAVFVPFVLPGEEVNVTILEEKTGFARATLNQLVQPSQARIEAGCPYFGQCGGCHYQQTGYPAQLEIKNAILRETLQRIGKFTWTNEIVVHSAQPWNYRNRTRMKVRAGENFALGYHRNSSHNLLAVKQCPISSPAINRVVQHLWQLGEAGRVPQGIIEIEFFADHADSALLLEIYMLPGDSEVSEFVRDLQIRVPGIKGISFFTQQPGRGGSLGVSELKQTMGASALSYQVGDKSFRVSAGSFFQTNRFLVRDLVQVVTAEVSGRMALDLYAGVGLFATHLAKRFEQVFAIESSPASASDLEANMPRNVTPVRTTAEQFLPKCHNLRPDLVVVDPPRAGLGDKAAKLLASLRVPRITYLSCDPTTLARDLRLFLDGGYRVEDIRLIDLFPQTFHIESMVRLAR
ncbi:MAG TPA: 23S rRNA (uracil(1939)-C(5))-methyltransferase RlmD [Candidatus Angelobacter sp.]|nr:23S rRNA (uracil(1939)-C(5))-methyltransferase RlmD [Candidatus Angelobacter sp.]